MESFAKFRFVVFVNTSTPNASSYTSVTSPLAVPKDSSIALFHARLPIVSEGNEGIE